MELTIDQIKELVLFAKEQGLGELQIDGFRIVFNQAVPILDERVLNNLIPDDAELEKDFFRHNR